MLFYIRKKKYRNKHLTNFILTIEPCQKKDIKTIIEGINEYNLSIVSALADVWTPLEFVSKNKNGDIIGGALAE